MYLDEPITGLVYFYIRKVVALLALQFN